MGKDEADPVRGSCVPWTPSVYPIFHRSAFFRLGIRLELCISQRNRVIARWLTVPA